MKKQTADGPGAEPSQERKKPVDGPRPRTEGEVRGLRDTSSDPPAAAVQPADQPTQVDPDEAKLSREDIARKIPPPGLLGDASGPSS